MRLQAETRLWTTFSVPTNPHQRSKLRIAQNATLASAVYCATENVLLKWRLRNTFSCEWLAVVVLGSAALAELAQRRFWPARPGKPGSGPGRPGFLLRRPDVCFLSSFFYVRPKTRFFPPGALRAWFIIPQKKPG